MFREKPAVFIGVSYLLSWQIGPEKGVYCLNGHASVVTILPE